MKLLYKYTFGKAPVDNLITNTIINGNLVSFYNIISIY